MRISAWAPCRIDLAGGTLDIHPLSLFIGGGLTVNLALSLGCSAELVPGQQNFVLRSVDGGMAVTAAQAAELPTTGPLGPLATAVRYFAPQLPATPFHLITHSTVPRGSGLGASSTLLLAVCAVLNVISRQPRSVADLIALTVALEAQALGAPAGYQDQYAAAHGGLAVIHTGLDGPRREGIDLTAAESAELARWLLLTWSGRSHHSASINWQVFKGWVDGDRAVAAGLQRVKAAAVATAVAARRRDWSALAIHLGEEWAARRSLALGIDTPVLAQLTAAAAAAGAVASKACGAGGGGCLVTAAPPARRDAVAAALTRAGGRVLPFTPHRFGLRVEMGSVQST